MKVILPEKSDAFTDQWLEIKIQESNSPPSVWIEGLGKIDVKNQGNKIYTATFLQKFPGTYHIKIISEGIEKEASIFIGASQAISFPMEMSIFLILLTLATYGVFKWTKKISGNQ